MSESFMHKGHHTWILVTDMLLAVYYETYQSDHECGKQNLVQTQLYGFGAQADLLLIILFTIQVHSSCVVLNIWSIWHQNNIIIILGISQKWYLQVEAVYYLSYSS